MSTTSTLRASLKRRLSPALTRTSPSERARVVAKIDEMDAHALRQALALSNTMARKSPSRSGSHSPRSSASPRKASPRKASPAKKGRKGKKAASPKKARSRSPSPARSPARSPSKMTVKQIQMELKKLKLHHTGKREVLLARLNDARKGQVPATQATSALKHKALGCPKKKNSPSTCITPKVKAAKAKRERGDSKERLVELCRQAGLKTTGNKEQLKARLANPSVNDHKKVKAAVNKTVKAKAKKAKTPSPKKRTPSPKKRTASPVKKRSASPKKGRGRPKKA